MSPGNAQPPHRIFRRLSQFSVRTMLILTTLFAIGIWWYQRPSGSTPSLLAGGAVFRAPQKPVAPLAATLEESSEASNPDFTDFVWHGRATVRDAHGRLLVSGRYRQDEPVGTWRAFHESGRLRARTNADTGAGWQTWHANGARQAITEAVASETDKPRSTPQRFHVQESYDNGQLRLQGMREDGLRAGLWTYWNRNGQVLAQGEYLDDLRSGPWQLTTAAGTRRQVFYLWGVATGPAEELFAAVDAAVASTVPQRRREAIFTLLSLGTAGQSRLEALLRQGPPADQRLVLDCLLAQPRCTPDLAVVVASMSDHASDEIARQALLARYLIDPAGRIESLTRLLEPVPDLTGKQPSQYLQQLDVLDEQLAVTLHAILRDSARARVHRPAIQLISRRLQQELQQPWPSVQIWDLSQLLVLLEKHPDPEIAAAATALVALTPSRYTEAAAFTPLQ